MSDGCRDRSLRVLPLTCPNVKNPLEKETQAKKKQNEKKLK